MTKKKPTKDYNKPISPFDAAERIARLRNERDAKIKAAIAKTREAAEIAADAKEAKIRARCPDAAKLDILLAAASGDAPPDGLPDWATAEPEPLRVQEVERG